MDTPETPLNVAINSALISSGFDTNTFDAVYRYVSNMNQNAGTITFKTFPNKILEKKSTLKLYLNDDYRKLEEHSQLILAGIHDNVAGITISRNNHLIELREKLDEIDMVLIIGERGIGKSGILKEYMQKYGKDKYSLIFRAEEFNYPHLQNVLTNIGVTSTIEDLENSLSAFSERFLVIESLEKLLELDNTKAFFDLLSIISQHKGWKVIATVRNYAVQQILMNFISGYPVKYGVLEVKRFNQEQISEVIDSIEILNEVKNNLQLLSMIQNPFYLDFLYRTLNRGYIVSSKDTKQSIKQAIWNFIIEKGSERINGLPQKRNKCFTQIALKRVKTMKYAVDEEEFNEEALLKLEEDELILRKDGLVCLAHDVLEDWAIERFIDKKYRTNNDNISIFLNEIGQEQAICRAYRLWLDNEFEDDDFTNGYIERFFQEKEVKNIWSDETLTAIICSNKMNSVLSSVRDLLLDHECQLLKRLCFIIRVSAKRPDMRLAELFRDTKDKELYQYVSLKPHGDCWGQIIEFLYMEKNTLPQTMYVHCINMLEEWSKLINIDSELPKSSREAGLLAFYILDRIKDDYSSKDEIERVFSIAMMTFDSINIEFLQFIEDTIFDDKKRNRHSYIDEIAKQLCSSMYCAFIAKNAPDLLIRVVKREWLIQEQPDNERNRRMFINSRTDTNHQFGINNSSVHDYFPPSGEREPFRSLFRFQEKKAVDFIIELCNIAVENYINLDNHFNCRQREIIDRITYSIKISEKTNIKQYATGDLWGAYRGMGGTPYVIQSALMALENWLIEHLEYYKDNKKEVDYSIKYLITKSNSVLTTAVVASAVMPIYKYLGESVLMLLQNNDFYEMDLSRSIHEMGDKEHNWFTFDNDPLKDLYISDRRRAANRSWRKETLESLCLKLQFTQLGESVFKIIDEINQKLNDDVDWRFRVKRIDTRRYSYKYSERQDGYIYTSEEIKEPDLMQISKETADKNNRMTRFSRIMIWAEEAIEGNAKFDIFETPVKVLYEVRNLIDISKAMPNDERSFISEGGILKAIAVLYRDFYNDFSNDQINWCREFIIDSFEKYDENLREITGDKKVDIYGLWISAEVIPLFSSTISEEYLFTLLAKGLTCCDIDIRYATARGIKKNLWFINKDLADELIKLVTYFNIQESKELEFLQKSYFDYRRSNEQGYYKWLKNERKRIILKKEFLKSDIEKERITLQGITLRMLMLCSDYNEEYKYNVLESINKISEAEKLMNDRRNNDSGKIDRYYNVLEYNVNAIGDYLFNLDFDRLTYFSHSLEEACQDAPNFMSWFLNKYDLLSEQSGQRYKYWELWGIITNKMKDIAKQLCKGENYRFDERAKLLRSYMYLDTPWQPIDLKNQVIKEGIDLLCGFAKETAENPIVFDGIASLMYYFPKLIFKKGIFAITNITDEEILDNLRKSRNGIFYLENVLHSYMMNLHSITIEAKLYHSCEKSLNALVEMSSAKAYYVREYMIKSKKIR